LKSPYASNHWKKWWHWISVIKLFHFQIPQAFTHPGNSPTGCYRVLCRDRRPRWGLTFVILHSGMNVWIYKKSQAADHYAPMTILGEVQDYKTMNFK
jgi:hypothetical protein